MFKLLLIAEVSVGFWLLWGEYNTDTSKMRLEEPKGPYDTYEECREDLRRQARERGDRQGWAECVEFENVWTMYIGP